MQFANIPALDLDMALESLHMGKIVSEPIVRLICEKTKELLVKESNIVQLSTPITVIGDIHGQLHDLYEIFKIGGPLPDINYLFLGDYVDRGYFSVETILLLICYKLRYPSRIHLIRGNHESRGITQNYGFYSECIRKYGNSTVWSHFTSLFDFFTLSCLIDDTIFCVHGGLSPYIQNFDQIKVIDRFREIPHEGPMADLLWSDPNQDSDDFSFSPRGAGYTFGYSVAKQFLHRNRATHILRAHQLCLEGYQVLFDGLLSTVWSAPNYCYRCGNDASLLQISESGERFFNVFQAAPSQEDEISKFENLARSESFVQYFL